MADLEAFLNDAAAEPFAWGERDCALMAADWIRLRRGVDPAAAWRGRYRTGLGCLRMLRRRGGLVAVFDAIAAEHGLARTDAPVEGDVGVVLVEIDGRPSRVAAIRAAFGWAMRIEGAGITIVRVEPQAAWSLADA